MRKTLLILSAAILLFTLSCKKDSSEDSINKNDRRNKYVGDYTVYERVGIMFQTGYNNNDTFPGVISKFVDTDSIIFPESDTSYLLFTTGDYGKPWSKGGTTFLYKLIGPDSIESDIDYYDLTKAPIIYGNNDSIVVSYLFGAGPIAYEITHRWVKN